MIDILSYIVIFMTFVAIIASIRASYEIFKYNEKVKSAEKKDVKQKLVEQTTTLNETINLITNISSPNLESTSIRRVLKDTIIVSQESN